MLLLSGGDTRLPHLPGGAGDPFSTAAIQLRHSADFYLHPGFRLFETDPLHGRHLTQQSSCGTGPACPNKCRLFKHWNSGCNCDKHLRLSSPLASPSVGCRLNMPQLYSHPKAISCLSEGFLNGLFFFSAESLPPKQRKRIGSNHTKFSKRKRFPTPIPLVGF